MDVIENVMTEDYAIYNGDCVEVISGMPDKSVDLSVYSPPFCGLYNYSSDDRDMSNNATYEGFYRHYEFLVKQMARVTKPGRINAVHCMDIPVPGQRDGYHDLPGKIIELHQEHGFDYQGRTVIWKEPLAVAIRTRLKHLTHKQLDKDSTACTFAAGDFLLAFRRRGANAEPVTHDGGFDQYFGSNEIPADVMQFRGQKDQATNRFSHAIWRRYASCVWDDIRMSNKQMCGDRKHRRATLSYEEARDPEDEKHVHPLQLDVINRCIHLWSNPGDVVLTPFMGVGSEVYGAVYNGRRGVGVELKPSYFRQAVKNIADAKSDRLDDDRRNGDMTIMEA
jgi:DNA modification methylase